MKLNTGFFWALITLLAFILYHLLYVFTNGDFSFVRVGYTIGLLAGIVLVLAITSLAMGAIISLFSIRKGRFKKQLLFISPLIFIAILMLGSIISSLFKKGEGLGDTRTKWLVYFKDVTSPPGLDYQAYKTGKFFTKGLEIERKDSIQVQKGRNDSTTTIFNVSWLTPSEYILTDQRDSNAKIFVKITSMDDSSYSCYFSYDSISSPPTYFVKLRKK